MAHQGARAITTSCLRTLTGLLALSLYFAPPSHGIATAAAPQEQQARDPLPDEASLLAELLRQLGSPRYIEREEASAALVALGPMAVPTLERALQSDDREVRQRVRQALREIALRDRPRKLAILRHVGQVGPAELSELQLPGWEILHQFVEVGPSSRRLLAEALESNWDFLDSVTGNAKEIDSVVSDRCLELLRTRSQTRRVASRGDSVAVMLSGLAGMTSLGDQTLNNVFTVIN
ncbi:MAG: hypothetical protein AAGF97_19320, partial [Planctomycetota bacterium]